jgi:protein involved in ribonucleotide reduction
MKIAYISITGNTIRFVNKLKEKLPNCEFVRVMRKWKIDEPFILITPTINFGQLPIHTKELLDTSSNKLLAVVGSGNRNWGNNFCKGAVDISKAYNVPLLHKYEMSGMSEDVEIVANKIKEIIERKG